MSHSLYEGKKARGNGQGNRQVGLFYDRLVSGQSFSGYEPNCCFLNSGQTNVDEGQFINISAVSGFNRADDGRALALVDWDHDGDIDIWTSNRNAPRLRLLRNDGKHDHHFLQIRLIGTAPTTPRDAIGARVTIHTHSREQFTSQIKTLRAGEGFLSQSSKWLHFGLGQQNDLDRIVVHWPGGDEETFNGLHANQRYQLTQGSGKATVVEQRRRLQLKPQEQTPLSEIDAARIPLTSAFPLPRLEYQTWEGGTVPLKANGKPLLINFFASWCAPCMEELRDFKRHQSEFEYAGLQIIALSVDGLGEDKATPSTAFSAIEPLVLPFTHGRATDDIVNNLHGLHDLIIRVNDRPFSVPTSFLVDAKGRLSVIYRGKVTPKTVIQDATYMPATLAELRVRSALLPGRIIEHPRVEEIATKKDVALRHAVAQILKRAGELNEAILHYREMTRLAPSRPDILSELGDLLLLQQDVRGAEKTYRAALGHDSEFPVAHVGLGNISLLNGDVPRAATHFERAISSDDEYAAAHLQLGVVRHRQGELNAAADEFREYLDLNPNSSIGNTRLATVLVALGEIESARRHFERGIDLDPNEVEAANGLAWILATAKDPTLRDGKRAVELASFASLRTDYRNPGCLDTLAAAHAECGNFDQAVLWQERAAALVPPTRREALQARLKLYKSNLPYRGPGPSD